MLRTNLTFTNTTRVAMHQYGLPEADFIQCVYRKCMARWLTWCRADGLICSTKTHSKMSPHPIIYSPIYLLWVCVCLRTTLRGSKIGGIQEKAKDILETWSWRAGWLCSYLTMPDLSSPDTPVHRHPGYFSSFVWPLLSRELCVYSLLKFIFP